MRKSKAVNATRMIMIVLSIISIVVGGCGLDSESLSIPIGLIVLGIFFAVIAILLSVDYDDRNV